MPRKPKGPQVGDRIRVVKPRFVKRVGYPLDREDILEEVGIPKFEDAIQAAYKVLGIEEGLGYFSWTRESPLKVRTPEGEILRALIFKLLRRKRFGGSQRKAIYQELSDLQGFETPVVGIRRKWEGSRYSGYSGTWDDPYGETPSFTPWRLVTLITIIRPEIRFSSLLGLGSRMLSDGFIEVDALDCEIIERVSE